MGQTTLVERRKKPRGFNEAILIIRNVLLVIICGEFIVMLVFAALKVRNNVYTGIGGSLALAVVCAPFLYWIVMKEIVGKQTEVSAIRNSQRQLAESETKYRALIEQSTEGVYLADPENKGVLDANPALLIMLGYTRTRIKQMTIGDLIAFDAEDPDEQIRNLEKKAVRARPCYYRRMDGTILECEYSASLIHYGDKKIVLINVRDMTEFNRMQRRLEENSIREG